MSFGSVLSEYMNRTGISGRELSQESGISEAALSRYRQGKRVPEGERVEKITSALFVLSERKGVSIGNSEEMSEKLTATLPDADIDYEGFVRALAEITERIGITNAELAKAMSFDPSHISRIFSGERRVNSVRDFAYKASSYIADKYTSEEYIPVISELTGCETDNQSDCLNAIYSFLVSGERRIDERIVDFLKGIDDFDLNEFIAETHFDEIRVPSVPFTIPKNRTYYGPSGMMDCELEFNKAVILSKSSGDVVMYSDMPIDEIAADEELTKKYMGSLAIMIKKGLHLNVIHNIDRPMNEMIEGLKGWIPLYMTGQISPYYLNLKGSPFTHMIRTSETAAAWGTGVAGDSKNSRFTLTQNRDEVRHIAEQGERLLKKASPLMKIYTKGMQSQLESYMSKSAEEQGDRYMMTATLPLFTMSDDLLNQIITANGLTSESGDGIRKHIENERELVKKYTENGTFTVILPEPDRRDTRKLNLSPLFLERDIICTPDQYGRHLDETMKFADDNPKMRIKTGEGVPLKNIQILLTRGKSAVISKGKAPAIHYAISHPNMIRAFERFFTLYSG